MNKPIILITVERINLAAKADEVQMVLAGCPLDYPRAVEAAGGVPLLLPTLRDPQALEAAVRCAHGLLLAGGGDISPLTYAEDPVPGVAGTDPERDVMEIELVRLAGKHGRPILGVCRGLQTINVALGGTLVQDIPAQVSGALQHRARALDKFPVHRVHIAPGSLLARVTESADLNVNSNHHQAAREIAPGLCVSATARDGIIEALESVDPSRRILAVQWHPEETFGRDRASDALFQWLVDEAAGGIYIT